MNNIILENKVIIAGCRWFKDYCYCERFLDLFLSRLFPNVIIISGTAKGVDGLGEKYAKLHNLKCLRFPAKWKVYGRSAGYLRNVEMAKIATHTVLFWDYKSKGTGHMLDIARNKTIPIIIVDIRRKVLDGTNIYKEY